jgi:2-polyprenyl-6-methoxyphenol hydroxylase-like FAD-dependent oxidoreductase
MGRNGFWPAQPHRDNSAEGTFLNVLPSRDAASIAGRSGASWRAGTLVEAVEPGANNAAVIVRNAKAERISARLAVGADGRGSAVRKWARFTTQKSPQPFHFAGVLLTGVSGRDDIVTFLPNPDLGLVVVMVPETKQR